MTKKDKLIDRVLSIPADLTYDEVKRFFAIFDYTEDNKWTTSGSRVRFVSPDKKSFCVIHKPHPSKIVKKDAIRTILTYVKSKGLIDNYQQNKEI